MKKYCPNCGSANEYSGNPPEKCAKCKANLLNPSNNFLIKKPVPYSLPSSKAGASYSEPEDDEPAYVEEPEPMSNEEIEGIFLANATKGVNLRDLIKTKGPAAPAPRKPGRPKKQ